MVIKLLEVPNILRSAGRGEFSSKQFGSTRLLEKIWNSMIRRSRKIKFFGRENLDSRLIVKTLILLKFYILSVLTGYTIFATQQY